jgi:hypothetical protein
MEGTTMTDEIKAKFGDLACALSPENLHCDGEISAAQARTKERAIRKEWTALERQVGRRVTENEVWGWIIQR